MRIETDLHFFIRQAYAFYPIKSRRKKIFVNVENKMHFKYNLMEFRRFTPRREIILFDGRGVITILKSNFFFITFKFRWGEGV